MNSRHDDTPADWLEGVLHDDARAHQGEYIDDAGFTTRVMDALPEPAVAALPAWRKPALVAIWALATLGIVLALPDAAADSAQQILRALYPQQLSLSGMGSILLALGAATWGGMAYALRKA